MAIRLKWTYTEFGTGLIWLIWIAVQIAMIITFSPEPLASDSQVYISVASAMAERATWYPTHAQVEGTDFISTYIIYPGLINFFAFLIRIFGTYKAIFWANLVFNILLSLSVRRLASTICNKQTGHLAMILFCSCPVYVTDVALALSEIPACAFAYAAAACCTFKNRWGDVAAGLLCAVAIYIRPTMLLVALAIILYFLFAKCAKRYVMSFGVSFILSVVAIIGINYYISDGYLFYGSNTLGVNMYIGANDEASGTYHIPLNQDSLDEELRGLDSFQCDSVFKSKAISWIKANPHKWGELGWAKIKYQFTPDTNIGMGRASTNPILTDNTGYIKKIIKLIWLTYPVLWFPVICVLAIAGMIFLFKTMKWRMAALLLPIAATILLCILTVGAYRYNATFFPILILFAAATATRIQSRFTPTLSIFGGGR